MTRRREPPADRRNRVFDAAANLIHRRRASLFHPYIVARDIAGYWYQSVEEGSPRPSLSPRARTINPSSDVLHDLSDKRVHELLHLLVDEGRLVSFRRGSSRFYTLPEYIKESDSL